MHDREMLEDLKHFSQTFGRDYRPILSGVFCYDSGHRLYSL